ncbi:MAG TPA: homoserine dehydrogenase [bacterium]|nr:homoserine dehydrogenase [bacterium]HPN30865.1 homoserine dehydrogenase [bacterium]
MKTINIGLAGFGTVGTGVVKILQSQKKELKEKTGIVLNLKRIVDIDTNSDRGVKLDKSVIISNNIKDIVEDKEIDIVVELIGGVTAAKQLITGAIKNGKHIVTANKALLSECAESIFSGCKDNNLLINFEASVCGGIPVLKALKEGLVANKITSIYGIVNGTANFILTQMSLYCKSFEDALKEAQIKGFAEANPAFDIEGKDSAHKLAALATLAYGITVTFKDIYCEGITEISPLDLKFAHKLEYEIKLLAIAKLHNTNLDLRVHPTLIPKHSILANTLFENNAVYINGDNVGPLMFYGKGAGMMPTASAVVSDIADIASKIINDNCSFSQSYHYCKQELSINPMFALKTKYYLRIATVDKTYVLSNISKILSDHQVSIASLLQTETNEQGNAIIVIMTHNALEKSVMNAVQAINKLSCVKGKVLAIRVEDNM